MVDRRDAVIAQLNLPTDLLTWTENQRHAYLSERLKEALDLRKPRFVRNACVSLYSNRIRKPEVLSEEVLRKRVEAEISGEPVKAKKNSRITHMGGLEILTKLLDRVEEANRGPFAFSVGAIILFGSFDRNDKSHAGDIDIAVEFVPKEPAGSAAWIVLRKSRVEAALKTGRDMREPKCHYWPKDEVAKFLQRRSTGISLADLDQISVGMEPNGKPFSYTILRGDAQTISRKFERSECGLKACRIRHRDPKSGKITTLFDDGTLTVEQSRTECSVLPTG